MNKKLGTGGMIMLLVIALGAIGIGYALWSKVLTIEGIVHTGSVNARIVGGFTDDDNVLNDPDKDAGDVGICEQPDGTVKETSCDPAASENGIPDTAPGGAEPRYDKDVAECFAEPNDTDPDQEGIQGAIVRTVNGYPSYYCTAFLVIENNGTIPVKVASATVNGIPIQPSTVNFLDLDGDGDADVSVHLTTIGLCQQIDPGQRVVMDVDQHVEQGAPQGATLQYRVVIQLNQWNEPGPLCAGDTIIDADGIASRGDGLGSCGLPGTPGSLQVQVGDKLTTWPAPNAEGPDWFDKGTPNGVFDVGCDGDDLHLEDPSGACDTAIRNGVHELGEDCKLLDHNNDLADGELVECDLETGLMNPGGPAGAVACPPTNHLAFHDANGNGWYDNGEDIVLDKNNNGIFD